MYGISQKIQPLDTTLSQLFAPNDNPIYSMESYSKDIKQWQVVILDILEVLFVKQLSACHVGIEGDEYISQHA